MAWTVTYQRINWSLTLDVDRQIPSTYGNNRVSLTYRFFLEKIHLNLYTRIYLYNIHSTFEIPFAICQSTVD